MLADGIPLTPSQVARRYRIGVHKVLHWITTGELRAINVATDLSRRPRWVITPDALDDFEARRAAQPKAKTSTRRRKRAADVIEFF